MKFVPQYTTALIHRFIIYNIYSILHTYLYNVESTSNIYISIYHISIGKISSRGAGNVTMAIYISGIIQHMQHYKH